MKKIFTPAENDLGIYIHIPFCPQQCHFCAFDTHPKNDPLMKRYLAALENEIDRYGKEFSSRSPMVSTLYLGGGTPSLLNAHEVKRLFKKLKQNFNFASTCEVSLEAHPSTLTPEKLQGYLQAGINRLSLGVQSYSDQDLSILKRPYINRTIEERVAQARKTGYQNISFDLMFGLPGQSPASWEYTLDDILGLSPDHLSLYALTVEPGTPLEKAVKEGCVQLPGEDIQRDLYDLACSKVSEHGYSSYEVSNFGKPGKECRHNQRYWQRKDYLGLGCSAHSSIGAERFSNLKTPEAYIRAIERIGHARGEAETLTIQNQLTEALIFGLRQTSGISLRNLSDRFLIPFSTPLIETIERLNHEGFLSFTQERDSKLKSKVRLTREGIHLSDEVSMELLAHSGHG